MSLSYVFMKESFAERIMKEQVGIGLGKSTPPPICWIKSMKLREFGEKAIKGW